MGNHIDFANAMLKTEKHKGKPKVYYNLGKYKNMGSYDVMTDITEHVTLLQLLYSLVNINNSTNVFGYWIFDSNYEIVLVLNI